MIGPAFSGIAPPKSLTRFGMSAGLPANSEQGNQILQKFLQEKLANAKTAPNTILIDDQPFSIDRLTDLERGEIFLMSRNNSKSIIHVGTAYSGNFRFLSVLDKNGAPYETSNPELVAAFSQQLTSLVWKAQGKDTLAQRTPPDQSIPEIEL